MSRKNTTAARNMPALLFITVQTNARSNPINISYLMQTQAIFSFENRVSFSLVICLSFFIMLTFLYASRSGRSLLFHRQLRMQGLGLSGFLRTNTLARRGMRKIFCKTEGLNLIARENPQAPLPHDNKCRHWLQYLPKGSSKWKRNE